MAFVSWGWGRRRRREEGSFQGYGTVKKWELETRTDEAGAGVRDGILHQWAWPGQTDR